MDPLPFVWFTFWGWSLDSIRHYRGHYIGQHAQHIGAFSSQVCEVLSCCQAQGASSAGGGLPCMPVVKFKRLSTWRPALEWKPVEFQPLPSLSDHGIGCLVVVYCISHSRGATYSREGSTDARRMYASDRLLVACCSQLE